ncbi:MAG: prsA [Bacteriovoracaceae bacterium]|nr:prsA [Bacteriovoracaceae bacterium]
MIFEARKLILFLAIFAFNFAACKNKHAPESAANGVAKTSGQEAHIEVQHILIGFKGSLPGKTIERTQQEAQKLANEILVKAKAGSDFEALVKQYTDDRAPGIYAISNTGITPEGEEFPREQMVRAFGDLGFTLKPGEIGIANFDKERSPFGFHIIKRLK